MDGQLYTARVSRGAIYWHFANKKALFDAMRAEVSLPMLDRTDVAQLATGSNDPLACVEKFGAADGGVPDGTDAAVAA